MFFKLYKAPEPLKQNKKSMTQPMYTSISNLDFNTLNNPEIFSTLYSHWKNKEFDNFEEDLLKVHQYFCNKGGIPMEFIDNNRICPMLLQIMLDMKAMIPNLFNLSLDIINQVIAHSHETVDKFIFNQFSILDQIKEILNPFFNESIINSNSFEPEMFVCPVYNVQTIDISIQIIWNICIKKKCRIDLRNSIIYLYREGFISALSNILKMKTYDNEMRDKQIVDCLCAILLGQPSKLCSRISDCNTVFQGYQSIFDQFYEHNCICAISNVCKNLLEILKEESLMIILFNQNGFYQQISNIINFIFANNINADLINSIFDFISYSLQVDQDSESDQDYENDNDIFSIPYTIRSIIKLFGTEHYVSNFYGYILNTTVERARNNNQDNTKCLFTENEELLMSYLFDILQQLITFNGNSIIEYKNIEEVFDITNRFGKLDLKISANNFIIGLILILSTEQVHQFLNLIFVPELFDSFISAEQTNADYIISAIENILNKISITNNDMLQAFAQQENNNKNEVNLILEKFPEVLQSFLDYEDGNQIEALKLLNNYYKE